MSNTIESVKEDADIKNKEIRETQFVAGCGGTEGSVGYLLHPRANSVAMQN